MVHLRLVAAGVLWAALNLHAATQRALPDGYTRRVWQTQDGLPENTVQAFAQTPDNYLWIGTSGGLVRFDGAGFVVYDRDKTPLAPSYLYRFVGAPALQSRVARGRSASRGFHRNFIQGRRWRHLSGLREV